MHTEEITGLLQVWKYNINVWSIAIKYVIIKMASYVDPVTDIVSKQTSVT
jgi:hypothetical protein